MPTAALPSPSKRSAYARYSVRRTAAVRRRRSPIQAACTGAWVMHGAKRHRGQAWQPSIRRKPAGRARTPRKDRQGGTRCVLGGWSRKPFRREAGYSFHGSTSRVSSGRTITRYATSSPVTGEPAGPSPVPAARGCLRPLAEMPAALPSSSATNRHRTDYEPR